MTTSFSPIRTGARSYIHGMVGGPSTYARERFFQGLMTRSQAAAMLALDPTFRAEVWLARDLEEIDPMTAAKLVVDEVWTEDLVKTRTGRA